MAIIDKLKDYLAKPFAESFILMLIWFLLMTGPELYFFMQQEMYEEIPYFLSRGFLAAYVFTLIYGIIRNKILRNVYVSFIYILISLFLVVDLFCITNLHDRYNYDMAAIILGTNPNEAGEFLSTYFNWNILFLLVAIFFLSIVMHRFTSHIHMGKAWIFIGGLLIAVSLYFSIKSNYMLNGIYAKYHSFLELPELPDLKAHQHDPQITFEKDSLPNNIAIIIGEAFAKSHCSLYGYEKETNPRLKDLSEDSSLFVFQNVVAPATHTLQAFQYILNTYQKGHEAEYNFADCITIPNVARYAGYKTYWLSNQSKHGQNDNLVGEFADLCDEEYFVDNKFAGLNRWSKDESVLPPLRQMLANDHSEHKFFFIHLMGSHFNCRARYTDAFDIFKEKDYLSFPQKQRIKLAEYDNSVLYNDYVVRNIIELFKDRVSVVIYFPDHGMDIYETSDDWCGHARDNDSVSYRTGQQIPFMVYLSRSFKQHHPFISKKMALNIDNKFCTDKLIYTVMHIMGINFVTNNDVKEKSLLKR